MLQTFSRCNIINKDHIIQRIILMEFTVSKSFPKQVASRVSRCAPRYRSIHHGRTEFHEIAYRLLQCLQSLLDAALVELWLEFYRHYSRTYETVFSRIFKANLKQICFN